MVDFDPDKYCSKCKAALLAASNFCPICGWPKNRRTVPYEADKEKVANNIERDLSPKELRGSKFKNEMSRPTGVTLLGIFHMVSGIFLVAFAIILGLAVLLLVVGSTMNTIVGIGDMGDMPMPPGMDAIDPMMSYLDKISGLPGMESLPSTSEISGLINSTGGMNMEVIMIALMGTFVIVVIVIILGLVAFVVGRGLLRGKKWARIVTIASTIISIPLTALYLGKVDDLILLGLFALEGIILYYMLRPQVREYFAQTSIKNLIKKFQD